MAAPARFYAELLAPNRVQLTDVNALYGLTSQDTLALDYDVISGEIFNVLTTQIGDEPFEPTYGSMVPNRLFDPMDASTAQTLKTDIYLALKEWIPQLSVDVANTRVAPTVGASGRGWDVIVAWLDPAGYLVRTPIAFRQ